MSNALIIIVLAGRGINSAEKIVCTESTYSREYRIKTLIAGSRNIKDEELVRSCIEEAIQDGFSICRVISGTADGVDSIAEEWAEENDISVDRYPYDEFTDADKPAPLARNDRMISEAEQAIVIWNGESNGTEYVIDRLESEDVAGYIHRTDILRLSDF